MRTSVYLKKPRLFVRKFIKPARQAIVILLLVVTFTLAGVTVWLGHQSNEREQARAATAAAQKVASQRAADIAAQKEREDQWLVEQAEKKKADEEAARKAEAGKVAEAAAASQASPAQQPTTTEPPLGSVHNPVKGSRRPLTSGRVCNNAFNNSGSTTYKTLSFSPASVSVRPGGIASVTISTADGSTMPMPSNAWDDCTPAGIAYMGTPPSGAHASWSMIVAGNGGAAKGTYQLRVSSSVSTNTQSIYYAGTISVTITD